MTEALHISWINSGIWIFKETKRQAYRENRGGKRNVLDSRIPAVSQRSQTPCYCLNKSACTVDHPEARKFVFNRVESSTNSSEYDQLWVNRRIQWHFKLLFATLRWSYVHAISDIAIARGEPTRRCRRTRNATTESERRLGYTRPPVVLSRARISMRKSALESPRCSISRSCSCISGRPPAVFDIDSEADANHPRNTPGGWNGSVERGVE